MDKLHIHNKALVENARSLRRNMTPQERKLWYEFLRDYPIKFIRQKIIGNYIADFYCAKARIVIELDGSQHFNCENKMQDNKRTEFLEQYNIKVIRIANNDVIDNFYGVCTFIDNTVKERL